MFGWIGSISNLFGYVLNFIYEIVGNYGVSIILFTLLAKILLAPLAYFQQKSMKKTALISEEIKKVQEKYKDNEKKLQEETMKIYKDNNSSPLASCSSCFTVLIQMFLILAMFYLVNEPLIYMKKIDPEVYAQYEIRMHEEVIAEKEAEQEEKNNKESKENKDSKDKKENKENKEKENKKEESDDNDSEKAEKTQEELIKELKVKSGILRPQMEMIARYREENEVFDINTEFLGLDLTQIPTNSLKDFDFKDKDTYKHLASLVIPALYMVISILNIVYTNKRAKKEKERARNSDVIVLKKEKVQEVKEDKEEKSLTNVDDEKLKAEDIGDAMKDANKSMLYFLPVTMLIVTMSAPISLALYWLTNTVLSFAEKSILDKILDKENKQSEENLSDAKTAVKVKKEKKK